MTTRDDHRVWDVPPLVPLLVLRSTHVFPLGVTAAQVTDPANVAALRALSAKNPVVVVVRAEAPNTPPAGFAGGVGVAAGVVDRMYLKDDAVQVTLLGKRRVQIDAVKPRSGGWARASVRCSSPRSRAPSSSAASTPCSGSPAPSPPSSPR